VLPYLQKQRRVVPRWIGTDCCQRKAHTGASETCKDLTHDHLRYRFELLAPLEFMDSGGYHHYINAGFRYNGMSAGSVAPRWIDDPRAEAAVCLHDKNYRDPPPGMKRADADRVLREGMLASGVDYVRTCLIVYPCVRAFGWWAWRGHRHKANSGK